MYLGIDSTTINFSDECGDSDGAHKHIFSITQPEETPYQYCLS